MKLVPGLDLLMAAISPPGTDRATPVSSQSQQTVTAALELCLLWGLLRSKRLLVTRYQLLIVLACLMGRQKRPAAAAAPAGKKPKVAPDSLDYEAIDAQLTGQVAGQACS